MALIWYHHSDVWPYRSRIEHAVSYYQETRGKLPTAVLVRPDEIEDVSVTAVCGVPVQVQEHSFELHFLLLDE